MCLLHKGCYWISCGREGITNEHSQMVKTLYGVREFDKDVVKSLDFTNCRFWEGPSETQWRASLRLANTRSLLQPADELLNIPTDYKQKACNWALSVQGRCKLQDVQHYMLVGFQDACHTSCAERGTFGLTVPLRDCWWKIFFTGRLWGRNMDPPLWTAAKNSVSGIASSSSPYKMFEATLSARKIMVTVFWSTLCDVVKPSTQICAIEFLNHWRSF